MKPLVQSLNLEVQSVSPDIRLASMIVLGLELDHLKHALFYAGGGTWQQFRSEVKSGKRPTWPEFCQRKAGISDATARNYLKCARVLAARLDARPQAGTAELLAMMSEPPSKLTPEQRQNMVAGIVRMALAPGDSMTTLRQEFLAMKNHAQGNTGVQFPITPQANQSNTHRGQNGNARSSTHSGQNGNGHSSAPATPGEETPGIQSLVQGCGPRHDIESMALMCGISPENARRISRIVSGKNYLAVLREMERKQENGQ